MKTYITFLLLLLFLIFTKASVYAACGTWVANPPGCYDANYNKLAGNPQQCGNGACCSTVSECTASQDVDPFQDTPQAPNPDPPQNVPPPPAGPSSSQTDPDPFTSSPQEQKCGTYFASTNQCIDAGDNSVLPEFSVCAPYNSQTCCQTRTMCETVYDGTTPLEPTTPEQTSLYHCGEYRSTGSLTGCYGVDSKLVPNAVSCTAAGYPTQCCKALSLCGSAPTERTSLARFDYCAQVPTNQQEACQICIESGGAMADSEGKLVPKDTIYTAVGCVHVEGKGLAADLIRLLLGISGGVALLSILAGAFIFTTSQGESSRVKQAKELITAAISGLFFIIFVVIILDFIGVKILQIPGLG